MIFKIELLIKGIINLINIYMKEFYYICDLKFCLFRVGNSFNLKFI